MITKGGRNTLTEFLTINRSAAQQAPEAAQKSGSRFETAPQPAPSTADRIAAYLREHGPMTAAACLRGLDVGLEEGTRALERLEKFGLIQRTQGAGGDVLLRVAD